MPFKLALRNIFSRKSSLFIVMFMMAAAMLLTVTNAIFDSTEYGVAETFANSFTGDFIVRPRSDISYSLFGDETPVTGNLTKIERLVPYVDIRNMLNENEDVVKFVPQLTGFANMEFNRKRNIVAVFGVDADDYVSMMRAISIIDGSPYADGERGVMMHVSVAKKIGAAVGDTVQFTIANGTNVSIRAVPVSAVYDCSSQNKTLERFVLIDSGTLRSLLDILDAGADGIQIKDEQVDLFTDNFDIDSLFDSYSDFEVDEAGYIDVTQYPADEMKKNNAENMADIDEASLFESDGTTWNFIVCRLRDGANANRAIARLNDAFMQNDWPVEAVNWRYAAGVSALYIYWIRIILTVGILVVLAAGFIVVNNTLVINVLDRTREIGTLRALGAGRVFICLECLVETMAMSVAAGIIGIALGAAISFFLTRAHIVFSNEFLIQLFGGDALAVSVSFKNVAQIFLFMMTLGALGWIYPVVNAVKVSPLSAMCEIDR